MAKIRNNRAFSLVEVLIAVGLVAVVLSMVAGAITVLDRKVANERLVPFPRSVVASDSGLTAFGYPQVDTDNNGVGEDPVRPNFILAPSKIGEAQAVSLWRQVKEMYASSRAVTMVNAYVVHNFIRRSGGLPDPTFVGVAGYLSILGDPLTDAQLKDPSLLLGVLQTNFPSDFVAWSPPASVDANSYRANTIFFLGTRDRILGILRVRAFQFTSNVAVPYRFYEVSLARFVWKDNDAAMTESWVLDNTQANFIEDISYRFVEDRQYPQDLVWPPTAAQAKDLWNLSTASSSTKDLIARLSSSGEVWSSTLTDAGYSRYQVAFQDGGALAKPDQWHVMLPDPSLSQGEDRARIVRNNSGGYPASGAILNKYNAIRKSGRFLGAFKVFP